MLLRCSVAVVRNPNADQSSTNPLEHYTLQTAAPADTELVEILTGKLTDAKVCSFSVGWCVWLLRCLSSLVPTAHLHRTYSLEVCCIFDLECHLKHLPCSYWWYQLRGGITRSSRRCCEQQRANSLPRYGDLPSVGLLPPHYCLVSILLASVPTKKPPSAPQWLPFSLVLRTRPSKWVKSHNALLPDL